MHLYGQDDDIRLEEWHPRAQSFDPDRIGRAMKHVAALSMLLPQADSVGTVLETSSWRKTLIWSSIFAFLVGIALLTAAFMSFPPLTTTPCLVSAGVASLIYLVHIPLVGLLVRGRHDSLQFMSLLLITQAIALPPLCGGVAMVANGVLDGSPRTVRRVRVVDLSRTSGRNASFTVEVESWLEGQRWHELRVSEETFHRFQRPRLVGHAELTVRQGAFGWPWWESIEPVTEAPN